MLATQAPLKTSVDDDDDDCPGPMKIPIMPVPKWSACLEEWSVTPSLFIFRYIWEVRHQPGY